MKFHRGFLLMALFFMCIIILVAFCAIFCNNLNYQTSENIAPFIPEPSIVLTPDYSNNISFGDWESITFHSPNDIHWPKWFIQNLLKMRLNQLQVSYPLR